MELKPATGPQIVYDGEVTREDLDIWNSELEGLFARMGRLFYRTESRRHAEQYVRGLLAPIQRKNGWTIAEYVGEAEPKALQRFLNVSPWDVDKLLELNRDYVMEHRRRRRFWWPIRPGSRRRAPNRSGCSGSTREHWVGSTTARSPRSWATSRPNTIGRSSTGACTCPKSPGWPIRTAAPRPVCRRTRRSRPGRSRSSR